MYIMHQCLESYIAFVTLISIDKCCQHAQQRDQANAFISQQRDQGECIVAYVSYLYVRRQWASGLLQCQLYIEG